MRVVFGFDMETDVGSFTPFYEGVKHGTPVILDVLAKHGITGTFYFTGDCVKKNPSAAPTVKDAGHEVGCHSLYHETVGDPLFEIPSTPPLLPEEVPNRLKIATQQIQDSINERPVSFRAPRLFGSTAMINALENLGYLSDASYPMYFYRNRITPYHPDKNDWTQVGDLRIIELPNFADLSMESNDPYGRDRDQWPLFRTKGADALCKHIDGFIMYCNEKNVEPFLCFYFHPWEFYKMPQGDIHFGEATVRPDPFIVQNCGEYAAEQLDKLIAQLKERNATFYQARQLTEEYSD